MIQAQEFADRTLASVDGYDAPVSAWTVAELEASADLGSLRAAWTGDDEFE